MNINDYFDRTVIINLPKRLDRRKETIEEFERIEWSADNGKTFFWPAVRPTESAGFPSIGARGCFMSHLNAIKQARHDHLKNMLLLEDDIAFRSDINAAGAELVALLEKTDWGFFYLGHEHPPVKPNGTPLQKTTVSLPLTHCYAINGTIFDRFIDFLEQVCQREPGDPMGGPMHYDGAISTFRIQNPDINTYITVPSLGYQRSSRTDLHSLALWDRLPGLSHITAGLRRAKNSIGRAMGN